MNIFDIHSVELTDFRSYRGQHRIVFPTAPGLYHLTGRNELAPRLGANGCGKSSLLDAIDWCLNGVTTRGLRASDVVAWGEKSCNVTVELTVGEERLKVERVQSPNSLLLNSNEISQSDLNTKIRIVSDSFLRSVIFPQFGDAFFDLPPSAKLNLFSGIMRLEYWLEKSQGASKVADEINAIRLRTAEAIATSKGALSVIQTDIRDLQDKFNSFEANKADEISKLTSNLVLYDERASTLDESLSELRKIIVGLEDVCTAADAEVTAAIAAVAQWHDSIISTEAELRILGSKIIDADVCPTCHQPVSETHRKAKNALFEKQKKRLDLLVRERDLAVSFRKAVTLKHVETGDIFQSFLAKERAIKQSIEDVAVHRSRTKEILEGAKASTNPFDSMIVAKRNEKALFEKRLDSLIRELSTLDADHEAVSYWVGGFKRLRLFLIERSLTQLEVEVNNVMAQLGLTEWRIKFDIERENKSGGVTKGFTVFVFSPSHPNAVRFECWSGGETQRLRLAGDLGLANLIMEQEGLVSQIEFYDEPSAHLSEEGLLDLAETLNQRAVSGGKRIFLVDHNAIDFGEFAGRMVVVKDENGSHLVS